MVISFGSYKQFKDVLENSLCKNGKRLSSLYESNDNDTEPIFDEAILVNTVQEPLLTWFH